MRGLPLLLTVAACGYHPGVGNAPTGDALEADGPAMPDADDAFVGPTASACVEKWLAGTMTFTTPAFLRSNGGALVSFSQERDPFLSSDELVLFFTKPGSGGDTDVMFAARDSQTADFNTPTTATSLVDSNQDDGKITMTGNDLTVIVASSRSGGDGNTDLWQATRTSAGITAFPPLDQMFLAGVNDADHQQDPFLSGDGLHLYLAVGSPQRIVMASRSVGLASFSAPAEIPNIGDAAGDADPTLSGDERVIVFASNRQGEGGTDLWYATRPEKDQPFSTPIALAEINTSDNDSDPHLSADGCHLYFASTLDPQGSDFDLFFVQQDP